jgi:hypothetical protein
VLLLSASGANADATRSKLSETSCLPRWATCTGWSGQTSGIRPSTVRSDESSACRDSGRGCAGGRTGRTAVSRRDRWYVTRVPSRSFDKLYVPVAARWDEKEPLELDCAWCGREVASRFGVDFGQHKDGSGVSGCSLRACSNCGYPTFIDGQMGSTVPARAYGDDVQKLPEMVSRLYQEARDCVSVGANHAAVMVCRKILMHVAVLQGAKENESFAAYVSFIVDHHLVSPNIEGWVDEIRQIANDANHEIFEITADDAKGAVDFVAMLLKLVYEFPTRGAASVAARAEKDASD